MNVKKSDARPHRGPSPDAARPETPPAAVSLTRRGLLRYSQLLVVFGAFLAMGAALVAQQVREVGVRSAGSLRLLAAGETAAEKRRTASGCLAIYSSAQQASAESLKDIEAIFTELGVQADIVDLSRETLPAFDGYDKVVLSLPDLTEMGQPLSSLMEWVRAGGQLMMYLPPEANGFFQAVSQQLGVREASPNWYYVCGIRFVSDLMLGGRARDFVISDPYESSLAAALDDACTVYAVSADDREVPLIWEYPNGAGRVVFCNLSITEKAVRGIYAQAFSLLGDSFAWPVIDGSAFYLDDFPSPVPSGSGEYIERDYGTSVSNFYTDVWWPDLVRFARERGIAFTGLIIEDYNDDVEPPFEVSQDVSRFQYFAGELLRLGGELGIHGYNHIPLVTEGSLEANEGYVTGTYEDAYQGYRYWPSGEDMDEALSELHGFVVSTFPGNEVDVYVPPSNILSAPGREALKRSEFGIRIIASIYFESLQHVEYVQDFGVSEDGIVETPRIISGGQIDDYMYICALSELNLHFVSSHFMHPDDMLDPDRGAEEGWQSAYTNICAYADWLYGSAPQLRNLTGTEMGAAVQRWHDLSVTCTDEGDALALALEGLHDEAYLFVRSRDSLTCGEVQDASVERLDGSLYLVCASAASVRIPKEEQA